MKVERPSWAYVPDILDGDGDTFGDFWSTGQYEEPLIDMLLTVAKADPIESPAMVRLCFLLAVHSLVHRFRYLAYNNDNGDDPLCDWYVQTSGELREAMIDVWPHIPECDKEAIRKVFERATAPVAKSAVVTS